MLLQDEGCASTNTPSKPKKDRSPSQSAKVLSQEELKAWWPFTRLDPKRFPKTKHQQEEHEDALL